MFLLKRLQFFEPSKFIPEVSNVEIRSWKRKILHIGTVDMTSPKNLLVAFPFSKMSFFSHYQQLQFSKLIFMKILKYWRLILRLDYCRKICSLWSFWNSVKKCIWSRVPNRWMRYLNLITASECARIKIFDLMEYVF